MPKFSPKGEVGLLKRHVLGRYTLSEPRCVTEARTSLEAGQLPTLVTWQISQSSRAAARIAASDGGDWKPAALYLKLSVAYSIYDYVQDGYHQLLSDANGLPSAQMMSVAVGRKPFANVMLFASRARLKAYMPRYKKSVSEYIASEEPYSWPHRRLANYLCQRYVYGPENEELKLMAQEDFGDHQPIVDDWEGFGSDEKRVKGLLDRHLRHCNHVNGLNGDFETSFFNVCPVEYLAIRRIRTQEGLPTAWPKHPLLETPFAFPPDPWPEADEPLVDKAWELIRKTFKNIPDW